jgi:hypothetical protein
VIDGAKLADVLSVERALEIGEMVSALGFPQGGDDLKRYGLLLRELENEERFGRTIESLDRLFAAVGISPVNGH